jgi:hypothetical protein
MVVSLRVSFGFSYLVELIRVCSGIRKIIRARGAGELPVQKISKAKQKVIVALFPTGPFAIGLLFGARGLVARGFRFGYSIVETFGWICESLNPTFRFLRSQGVMADCRDVIQVLNACDSLLDLPTWQTNSIIAYALGL